MHQFAACRLAYMSTPMSIPSGSVPARSIYPSAAYLDSGRLLMHLSLLRTCVGLTGACSNPDESLCRCPDLSLKCDPIGGRRPRRDWPHDLVSIGDKRSCHGGRAQRGRKGGGQVHTDDPGRPGHMRVPVPFPVVNV